jgi:predicted nucleotidyltransferase
MQYGLEEDAIIKIRKVFSNYPEIDKVIVYGSRAKGNFKPGSDIDLVLFGMGLSLQSLNKISLELDDLLLPHKMDICIFHQISNKDLTDHIQRVGKIFYQKNKE